MTEKAQLAEARAFLEELAEKPPKLPYEPMLLPMLFAATKDGSTASVDDLTELIERSQKLAVKVLSIANSAVYALESTVTSLRRAVSILGFREVRSIVIMLGAVSAIKGVKLPKTFNANKLWVHQLKTAAIAKGLAEEFAIQQQRIPPAERMEMGPDEAYAAGLLHDIGKVFLAAGRPAVWDAIAAESRARGISFTQMESEYWGIDHALIGAQILHYWKLPLLLTDSINWHHAPDVAPAYKKEASLLAAANIAAHEGIGEDGLFPEKALAALPLPPGMDAAALGLAAQKHLQAAASETFAGLMG